MAKKNKKEKRQRKGKEVIDLTSYISPEMLQADVDGSYTGVPRETYYEDIPAEPVQKSALQALQCAFLFMLISS